MDRYILILKSILSQSRLIDKVSIFLGVYIFTLPGFILLSESYIWNEGNIRKSRSNTDGYYKSSSCIVWRIYRKIFNVVGMLDVSWDAELLTIYPITIAEADISPLLSCEARIKSDCYVKGGLDSFTSKSQSKIDNCLYRKYGYVETGRNFKAFISCSDPCVVTEIHASREFASGMNIVGVVLCSFGIVLILVGLVHYVIIPEEEEFSTIVMMTMQFLLIHLLEKKSQILLLNQQMKTLVTILPYHLLLHPMCRPTVELIVRIRLLLSL